MIDLRASYKISANSKDQEAKYVGKKYKPVSDGNYGFGPSLASKHLTEGCDDSEQELEDNDYSSLDVKESDFFS